MEKVVHKTKGLCTIWSEFTDYLVLIDRNGKHFQAHPKDITRESTIDSTTNELSPNLSFLESCLAAEKIRVAIDINDLSLIAEDLTNALGIDEDVARVIVMARPDSGYYDYPSLDNTLAANGISLEPKVLEDFKANSLIIFGGVEKLY